MRTTLFVLILGLVASTVYASDGVFEINADCAVFGCFDGDSSGYPVTITNPGSYRLTGNLTTSNVDTTLISVSADSVTIDLNGFALIGPVTCSPPPPRFLPMIPSRHSRYLTAPFGAWAMMEL